MLTPVSRTLLVTGLLCAPVAAFAAVPTVATSAAQNLTTTSATLGGSVNPNSLATTAWLRYSPTQPGTCTDSFGTRVPETGGFDLGSGSSSVPFSQSVTGLTPGTTYYFCALAENASGVATGSLLSFRVPQTPTVTTAAATNITGSSARLQGTANPNLAATTAWFRVSTTDPGACDDTFGDRWPSTGGTSLGSGTSPVTFTRDLTGLTPLATYYYCAIASNNAGTSFGQVLSFIIPTKPTVTTKPVSILDGESVLLSSDVTPNGAATTAWFRYSLTNPGSCTTSFGSMLPSEAASVGAGTAAVGYQYNGAFTAGATYYVCAFASNQEGTSSGGLVTITMPSSRPEVTTDTATSISIGSVTLRSQVNPHGDATTVWYRYDTTDPMVCDDTFGVRTAGVSAGSAATTSALTEAVAGMPNSTTFYFCAVAENSFGKSFGEVMSFSTPTTPVATTAPVETFTATSATLPGSAAPNGDATTGYFRYDTMDPGTCNDTFGIRAPTSGGSSLGSSFTSQAFSRSISGLTRGTTYYYCAIAQSSLGTAFGEVKSFRTVDLPVTTTDAASPVAATSATLRGTVFTDLAATTIWFRYSTSEPASCTDSFGTRAPSSGGASAGANTTYAASQSLSSLAELTTYYYCVIASNNAGTSFGQVLSFTTLGRPTVTTNPASNFTSSTATLNGEVIPNGAPTTGWFRYTSSSTSSCTDSFGTRVPSSGGIDLGADFNAVGYSLQLSNLSAGGTYYYCAIATNTYGTRTSTIRSFTVPLNPTATIGSPTDVTSTSATLNGSVNPRGTDTTAWFRFGAGTGTCNDSFGTRVDPANGMVGSGSSSVSISAPVTELTPGTTYTYCIVARSAAGTTISSSTSFITPGPPSIVSTDFSATTTSATLGAYGNPAATATSGYFRWGTTKPQTCDNTYGDLLPATGAISLGSGSSAVRFTATVSGLTSGTDYYYCVVVTNSYGTVFSEPLKFHTSATAIVTTVGADVLTATQVKLKATVTPHAPATVYFRYSTSATSSCYSTFGTATTTQSLPAGGDPVDVEQLITVTSGTTYYFCAVATNSQGTVYGAVKSFTRAQVPTVGAVTVSDLTGTGATLKVPVNPNSADATVWFRVHTSNLGTCNDTIGTRVPESGGQMIPAGTTLVDVTQAATGMNPGTTYYVCALAETQYGRGVSSVVSFSQASAPTVTSTAATGVRSGAATLNGTVHGRGAATTAWFRLSTTNPGTCDDSFGTRFPTTGSTVVSSFTTSVSISENASGLTAGTTYYYCAIAQNAVGTSMGSVLSFSTTGEPYAVTENASDVTLTGAKLKGTVSPNGRSTTAWFRYSSVNPGSCYDSFGTRVPSAGVSVGAGMAPVAVEQALTGLTPGATYYYCVIAQSDGGTSFGSLMPFTLSTDLPAVTTGAATSVQGRSATLQGAATPNGDATTGWFRFSTQSPGSCNDSFGTRQPATGGYALGSGGSPISFSSSASLLPATTYYYCAIAQNTVGTAFGSVQSFTTPAAQPDVTTQQPTTIGARSATLQASVNPGGAATVAWFRIDSVSRTTCNDSFGTRVPGSGGTNLSASNTTTTVTATASGLQPGVRYYYCALAQNSAGTTYGAMQNFTAAAETPTILTGDATVNSGTSATLRATADANASSATVWYRYDVTQPATCNNTFGTRTSTSLDYYLGPGTGQQVSANVTGLTRGRTYYYCAIIQNSAGYGYGAIKSFRTPGAPEVTTLAAQQLGSVSLRLLGQANANGKAATAAFYLSRTAYQSCQSFPSSARLPTGTQGTQIPPEAGTVSYSYDAANLQLDVSYYYCAVATNSEGTSYGAVGTIILSALPPIVTTKYATDVTGDSAVLNGSANPNELLTVGLFRYGRDNPGACSTEWGTQIPPTGINLSAGFVPVNFNAALTGLPRGVTYYYCAVATNEGGTSFGQVQSFTTEDGAPTATTVDGHVDADAAVELEGIGSTNGHEGTAGFRYGIGSPESCDDTFGTESPSPATLPSDAVEVTFQETITGLAAGSYFFCARVSTEKGVAFGEVKHFVVADVASRAPGGCQCGSTSLDAWLLAGVLAAAIRAGRRRARLS